jgi:hypothetical protein
VLTSVASDSALFPPGLFLTNVQNVSPDRHKRGGFADVYMGLYDNKPVALKRLLVNDGGRERNRIHRVSWKLTKQNTLLNSNAGLLQGKSPVATTHTPERSTVHRYRWSLFRARL